MSGPLDPTLRDLNDCACCTGTDVRTPRSVDNRPGLTSIAYRAGVHADFKQTMLARLPSQSALHALTTRRDNDFSVALLDAWATVADVLTFYTERGANESSIPTAKEQKSLHELAALIGYRPSPGVAASVRLAFTLDPQAGALGPALNPALAGSGAEPPPGIITIPAGTKVQSIPAQDEKAQIFETVEAIEALAEWNAMRPRLTQPQALTTTTTFVLLNGTATNLKQGDMVVIAVSGQTPYVKRVHKIETDDDKKLTRVDFSEQPPPLPSYTPPIGLLAGKFQQFAPKTVLNKTAVTAIAQKSWKSADLWAVAKSQVWPVYKIAKSIAKIFATSPKSTETGVFALRDRAAVFGHNAPVWNSLPASMRFPERVSIYNSDGTFNEYEVTTPAFPQPGWEGRTLEADKPEPSSGHRSVYLDNVYSEISAGGWLVLTSPTATPLVLKVTGNSEVSRSDFSISGKISRVRVARSSGFPSGFKLRNTVVYGNSEQLDLAELPIEDDVSGNVVTLDGVYLGLKDGQTVIVSGERTDADLPGVHDSEVMTLQEIRIDAGFIVLTFTEDLAFTYIRDTVTINANIASATHGETVEETLGGGDASQPFQRFELKQPPLTYVSADVPGGASTTLEVRVDDLLWKESPNFFRKGRDDRIYVTRTDDTASTELIFGDGITGARPPTGQTNVRAKYRKGIGSDGNVDAGQLAQLLSRPLGVNAVTNPLAASGGADSEAESALRRNVPTSVLVLGRIVSLRDYEDFARTYAGIDKALATWSWTGAHRSVFVTIAGASGATVPDDSILRSNLLAAMKAAGDPTVPVDARSYIPRPFLVDARIKVADDYLPEKVLEAAETALRYAFRFEIREFGQSVTKGEIFAILQGVEGVVAVDLEALHGIDEEATVKDRLVAAAPRSGGDTAFAAELLLLDDRPVSLKEM